MRTHNNCHGRRRYQRWLGAGRCHVGPAVRRGRARPPTCWAPGGESAVAPAGAAGLDMRGLWAGLAVRGGPVPVDCGDRRWHALGRVDVVLSRRFLRRRSRPVGWNVRQVRRLDAPAVLTRRAVPLAASRTRLPHRHRPDGGDQVRCGAVREGV